MMIQILNLLRFSLQILAHGNLVNKKGRLGDLFRLEDIDFIST